MKRQPFHLFPIWLTIGWLLILLVLYASLTSNPLQTPGIAFGDKIGHFLAYFTLVSWFCQLYKPNVHTLLFGLFITMGVLLEFIQSAVGYRTFDVVDMLANSAGAVCGWLLVKFLYAELLLNFERRLLPNTQ